MATAATHLKVLELRPRREPSTSTAKSAFVELRREQIDEPLVQFEQLTLAELCRRIADA